MALNKAQGLTLLYSTATLTFVWHLNPIHGKMLPYMAVNG
jgi:hypothetical protein